MRHYFKTLMHLVKSPKAFFSDVNHQGRLPATAFLVVSSAVSAASAMAFGSYSANLIQGSILMVNNFGMVILTVSVAYAVMVPLAGTGIGFHRLFGVYAYSSGVTLLFSWNPALIMFTEPWRWWLTWKGMRLECGLSPLQSAIILTLSILIIVMLFCILLPLTAPQ